MTSTATQDDGQLWTDERINRQADDYINKLYPDPGVWHLLCVAMTQVRDDYQARLRTVEGERDTRADKLSVALMIIKNRTNAMIEIEAERDELARIIQYIDDHTPRADDTCEEPGITLSQAARKALNAESGDDQ